MKSEARWGSKFYDSLSKDLKEKEGINNKKTPSYLHQILVQIMGAFSSVLAGVIGIEPTLTVLETAVLPLYDTPKGT